VNCALDKATVKDSQSGVIRSIATGEKITLTDEGGQGALSGSRAKKGRVAALPRFNRGIKTPRTEFEES
jgi:hypothetical protein